jgi:hypothetical protein
MHDVPVPKNEALVRQFGVFKTRAEAAAREQALIAQYGRKGLDPGGTLLNRTLGGEGVLGYVPTPQARARMSAAKKGRILSAETRARMSAARKGRAQSEEAVLATAEARKRATAAKYGLDPDVYLALPEIQRSRLRLRYSRGKRGAELLVNLDGNDSTWAISAANEYGVTPEQWDALTKGQRRTVVRRYQAGNRGAALLANFDSGGGVESALRAAADKYGVPYEQWKSFTKTEKKRLVARYQSGKRGADLLQDLDGSGRDPKIMAAATKYGITYERWESWTSNERQRFTARYRRGIRGAALLEGLI